MKTRFSRYLIFGALFALLMSLLMAIPSKAQISGVSIDFAAAEPTTYSHITGGGKWNAGTVNVDIERSLEGEEFACKDKVSYLTKLTIPNSPALIAMGAMIYQLKYSFDLDTTGQSGVALNIPITASINDATDSASRGDGNSAISLVSTSTSGPIFTNGSELFATFNITDVEANETIVIRIDLTLDCLAGSTPTGNLQAKYETGFLIFQQGNVAVSPAEAIGGGAKTIDLKSTNLISTPQLVLAKTVTFPNLSCPGGESVLIAPNDEVKYCYVITNPSNTGGKLGAPVFNISQISDDSGIYPDFTVNVTSGLTDLDSDGQADDLAAGATATAEKVLAFDGNKDTTLVNTATVTGNDASTGGNTLTATDTATVYIDAPEAAPSIDIQKTPDTQTVFDGLTATFSITVTNTGNVDLTNVAVTDAATPSCDKSWSSLAAGASETYTCTTVALLASFTNTAVVTGTYETTTVTDQDSAAVTIDFLPKIDVSKSASVASVPETGGLVTFTVVVTNNAVENFTLNSLIDDKFGNLNGVGTCAVPQTIAAGAQYSCTFDKTLSSDSLVTHVNTVTASGQDPEGNPASKSDDASVSFSDVLPDISLTKTANPTAARWTGDYIDYTFRITNVGTETVTVTSFVDDKIMLSAQCLALVGSVLAPGAYVECVTIDYYLTGTPGGSFINTATAVAKDNEMNSDTANASATVNFWWYGRTPGYWKNHPEDWNSGYSPNGFIQDVFTVPSGYLSGGVLDLDKNGSKDKLIDGLAYRGGTGLSGGAQIMFRAAIAALLNEAYYGADYPGAESPTALIALVNSKLVLLNRAQLILLGGYYDFWNNAVHASLP
jgi:uncharacterized repeat protein (TIGR01451 family)